VHLHLAGEVLVERGGTFEKAVAAAAQVVDQPCPVTLEVLGRHAPRGPLDHLVRDLGLELAGHLHPGRALEPGQELAILLPPVPREPLHAGVVVVVVLEDGRAATREPQDEALVARERLVTVVGDGDPGRPIREPRPTPLVAVAVPVADQDVEEPRLQEGAGVGLLRGIGGDPLV
jgi:hypothetical protein